MTLPTSIAQTQPYMLACNVPLLSGQTLCSVLENMDKEEQEAILKDQNQITEKCDAFDREHGLTNKLSSGSTLAGLAGTVAGFVLQSGDNRGPGLGFAIILGSFCLATCGVTGILLNTTSRSKLFEELESTIIDERICRLQSKIRNLESQLQKTTSGVENEQLNCAKDFFKTKELTMV